MQDRCERRLFTSAALRPTSFAYVTISQKLMSAMAARYAILWLANLVKSMLADPNFRVTEEFLNFDVIKNNFCPEYCKLYM